VSVVLGVVLFFILRKDEIKGSVISEYIKGKPDTVFVAGKPDTVTIYKAVKQYIKIPYYSIQQYGKDSSVIDTTVIKDSVKIKLTGVTYPAIDSLKFSLETLTPFRYVERVDSFFVHATDTLKVTTTIIEEQAWYNQFWTGALTVTGIVAGVLIFAK
jgi:hypothetical protein